MNQSVTSLLIRSVYTGGFANVFSVASTSIPNLVAWFFCSAIVGYWGRRGAWARLSWASSRDAEY